MFAEALRSSDQSIGGVIGTELWVPASFISHELVMSIIQEVCKSKLHDWKVSISRGSAASFNGSSHVDGRTASIRNRIPTLNVNAQLSWGLPRVSQWVDGHLGSILSYTTSLRRRTWLCKRAVQSGSLRQCSIILPVGAQSLIGTRFGVPTSSTYKFIWVSYINNS